MKTNLRKAGESTAFLVAREEYRAELRISIFRTAFILLLLVTNLVQSLLTGISLLAEVLPLGILLILSVFMLIDIWWLGRSRFFSRFYRPSHKYLIITLDVLGFSVMLHLAFLHSDVQQQLGLFGLSAPLLLAVSFLALFGLYIILDLLRFSVGSSYYTLLLFSLGFGGVYYLMDPAIRGPIVAMEALIHASLFFFPSLLFTMLSAYVSSRIAEMVLQSKIQQQLERYLPPALTRENLETHDIQLDAREGKKGPAAILFSDIRKFTSISEGMNPQEVVDFLNTYFNDMIEVVYRHGGTIDKIVGDEIMVLYGTPVFTRDYCDRAVRTALDMIDQLEAFNEVRALQGSEAVGIGIGIHQGEVVYGSIGSPRRMDFTAIGDAVNTASRLERLTRKLSSHIVISEQVYGALSKKTLREIEATDYGLASVRGKAEKFHIYGIRRRKK
jgi:class 3 adenylate cyclase